MRVSVIEVGQHGTRYAFGSRCDLDGNDIASGTLPHAMHPEGALYAAAGFSRGGLIAPPGDGHVLLVLAGLFSEWLTYQAAEGDWRAGKVGAWTRWTHRDHADTQVWVLLLGLAEPGSLPVHLSMYAEGSPAACLEMCARILIFADAVGSPFVLTAGHTAHMALRNALRPDPAVKGVKPDRRREPYWGTGSTTEPPSQAAGDLIWQRPPTRVELAKGWVHSFDLNAARLAALGTVEVPAGRLEATGPIGFDGNLGGYWMVNGADLTPQHVWPWMKAPRRAKIMPPLITRGGHIAVTAPIMRTWQGFGILPAVLDARVAPARRLFRTIANRWNHARIGSADLVWHEDVKAIYRAGAGLLASPGGLIHRPEWYHTLMDEERIALLRWIVKIHEATGQWPMRVHTDCIWYAANTADPIVWAEYAGIPLDPYKLGHFKVNSTGTMAETFVSKGRVA